MMIETFAAWRLEIEAELEQARKQLAADLKVQSVADATAANAKAELGELTMVLARLPSTATLSNELAARVRAHDDALRQAAGAALRARNAARSSTARIADLEAALQQIS